MAAIIRMIATTISSSISEKPFCRASLGHVFCPLGASLEVLGGKRTLSFLHSRYQTGRPFETKRQIRGNPRLVSIGTTGTLAFGERFEERVPQIVRIAYDRNCQEASTAGAEAAFS